ncbi:MAG: Fic family protein [Clostridiales bacterium]|nr:Fic family protein [Clostridiales bacterium]
MEYELDSLTDDCYEGTTCLINKLGIRDEKKLRLMEAMISAAKCGELETNPIDGKFDFSHFKNIHRFIFEDLYDWAGEVRKVAISKKGTRFVQPDQIESIAHSIFGLLAEKNYFKNDSFDEFVDDIVDLYIQTNMLHPFREGNGRAQRAFLTHLIRNCGYDIQFSKTDSDELMIATVFSAQGIDSYLKDYFRKNLVSKHDNKDA